MRSTNVYTIVMSFSNWDVNACKNAICHLQTAVPEVIFNMNFSRKAMKGIAVLRFVNMIPSFGIPFSRYLINSEITERNGMIILRPDNNANISAEELKRVTTLVTLRRLNLVKHLEMFLNSLARLLPPDTNFVGCFSPAKDGDAVTVTAGRHGGLTGWFLHSGGTECHVLNRSKVSEMLERNGLSLISMTEMNGVTYFHSRKITGHPFMIA